MTQNNSKQIPKIRMFFVCFLALLVIQISFVFFMSFYVKDKLDNSIEERYHNVDKVYADQYISSMANEGNASIDFINNDICYVALIDADGNVIQDKKGTEVNVSVSNIFKLLSTSDIIRGEYDSVVNDISNGTSGRVEFFNAKQSKILIYTPITGTEYSIVRILTKKSFSLMKNPYPSYLNYLVWLTLLIAVGMFAVVHLLSKYALDIEMDNARHELIAADNDLISFTYHSSIASFEMTGAVNKIFGDEIGKRSQVDWNSLSQLIHPDDQTLLRNISKAIKDGDAKYTTEFRMTGPNGDYHWYRLNGKSIRSEDGDVSKFVGTIQNSDDQITHENMLKNKAEHDLLTGLLNKITVEDSVNEALKDAAHNTFSFFIIDLDNFKAVNDNLGHAAGDRVLTDVASKLQLVFNEADYIGRLGGDEFAVLLVIPSMMVSQAEKLTREKAMLLNDILREEYGNDDVTIKVSASIGIATYPSDGMDFQTLYQHGDKALYHSKENGKNQFTFYNALDDSEK